MKLQRDWDHRSMMGEWGEIHYVTATIEGGDPDDDNDRYDVHEHGDGDDIALAAAAPYLLDACCQALPFLEASSPPPDDLIKWIQTAKQKFSRS